MGGRRHRRPADRYLIANLWTAACREQVSVHPDTPVVAWVLTVETAARHAGLQASLRHADHH